MKAKKTILILTNYYIPSQKGGGPIQSIKNLIDHLSSHFEFYIITSDRDLGENKPYSTILVNRWNRVGNAEVFYASPKMLALNQLAKIINCIDYDVLYLNSFFSPRFSIFPVLLYYLKKIKGNRIVIAPRGEFIEGAIKQKWFKKNAYLKLVQFFGLYNNVEWHATSFLEEESIKNLFGYGAKVQIASNLTEDCRTLSYSKRTNKRKGHLKIIFISRIHPKKNLNYAFEILTNVTGEIEFSIFGPIEDEAYWSICQKSIRSLPENINVYYRGLVDHKDVVEIFKGHHVFLFPTLGENFGHVIFESLIGGCPVITSDQTPWRGLNELNVGWDIPLNDKKRFTEAVQYYVDMNNDEYLNTSKAAFAYGKRVADNGEDKRRYHQLFSHLR